MNMEEMTSGDRPLVRAVLRAGMLLVPEAFQDRTPSEYAHDPAAMEGLAVVVETLAAVHLAAARYGAVVVSPQPAAVRRGRMAGRDRSNPPTNMENHPA